MSGYTIPSIPTPTEVIEDDEYKCDACNHAHGAFHCPKICVVCDGSSKFEPIHSTSNKAN